MLRCEPFLWNYDRVSDEFVVVEEAIYKFMVKKGFLVTKKKLLP